MESDLCWDESQSHWKDEFQHRRDHILGGSQEEFDWLTGDSSFKDGSWGRISGQALVASWFEHDSRTEVLWLHRTRQGSRGNSPSFEERSRVGHGHSDISVLPSSGNLKSLRRFIALTAAAVVEGQDQLSCVSDLRAPAYQL